MLANCSGKFIQPGPAGQAINVQFTLADNKGNVSLIVPVESQEQYVLGATYVLTLTEQ